MSSLDNDGNTQEVRLGFGDLRAVLRLGWADFRAAPVYGLFFAGVYVLAGLILLQLGAGMFTWTLTLSLGFPLVAPFLAVGLYEVSRRLERGAPLVFSEILGVIWQERTRQIPWAGAIIVIYFLFWSFFAHMLFALFMGPSALLGPPDDITHYLTGRGLALTLTELASGAVLAFLLFALTAVSLPMLLDREVDFVTAMLTSLRVTRDNLRVMLVWACMIAVLTLLALVPWFLGLFLVLPILGHASWHLYRRVVP
ncbi:DUF2189 domain-containing protein [Sulfitobacter sp. D35]|uniref:DUF2189 domain-containing protein n=1 Tax=Sulfitobacter sp. D35 TaxID=3083252 RepID=UPI00296FCEBC|nr:DUF2189 domain-containing protein [Sulfitobacter sp. D35]MDW4498539.1 DUF2189 domain-containing protein [Sulfitobacter sp. D35]